MALWESKGPVVQPAPAGTKEVSTPQKVVVVGGGLAGCAAATVLAERGVDVTVIESQSYLGGRVGGWADSLDSDGTEFTMERGFHAFFRQYYNVRSLLRRIDPALSSLSPLHDYPIYGPNGHHESFAALPKQTPLNLMTLVKRTPTIGIQDLLRIPTWPTLEMLSYDQARTFREYDGTTAGEFLDSLRFPPKARQMLFDVFAHSFFNPQYDMSAAEMIKLFHFYFTGNPEGLIFDVLNKPFSIALWTPLRAYLEERGVRFLMETRAEKVQRIKSGWRVHCKGQRQYVDADATVLAVTVKPLKGIVAASPCLSDDAWNKQIQALDVTSPFAIWRLWLDRAEKPGRAPFVGTAGLGILDNISLYHQFQDESRDYVKQHGGAVVELHGYALDSGLTEQEIKADLWANFLATYPEFRGAKVRAERYRRDQDCPSFAPGAFALRPNVKTPFKGVALAGDFVRLNVPAALMEGAVTSGYQAANQFLADWGVQGQEILSIPLDGMLSRLAPKLNVKRPGSVLAANRAF